MDVLYSLCGGLEAKGAKFFVHGRTNEPEGYGEVTNKASSDAKNNTSYGRQHWRRQQEGKKDAAEHAAHCNTSENICSPLQRSQMASNLYAMQTVLVRYNIIVKTNLMDNWDIHSAKLLQINSCTLWLRCWQQQSWHYLGNQKAGCFLGQAANLLLVPKKSHLAEVDTQHVQGSPSTCSDARIGWWNSCPEGDTCQSKQITALNCSKMSASFLLNLSCSCFVVWIETNIADDGLVFSKQSLFI